MNNWWECRILFAPKEEYIRSNCRENNTKLSEAVKCQNNLDTKKCAFNEAITMNDKNN